MRHVGGVVAKLPPVAEQPALRRIAAVRAGQPHVRTQALPGEIHVLDHRGQRRHVDPENRQAHPRTAPAPERRLAKARLQRRPGHSKTLDPRGVRRVFGAIDVAERPHEDLHPFRRAAPADVGGIPQPRAHKRQAHDVGGGIAIEKLLVGRGHRPWRIGPVGDVFIPVGRHEGVVFVLVERRNADVHAHAVGRNRLAAGLQDRRGRPRCRHRDALALREFRRAMDFHDVARREAVQFQDGGRPVDAPREGLSRRLRGERPRNGRRRPKPARHNPRKNAPAP